MKKGSGLSEIFILRLFLSKVQWMGAEAIFDFGDPQKHFKVIRRPEGFYSSVISLAPKLSSALRPFLNSLVWNLSSYSHALSI